MKSALPVRAQASRRLGTAPRRLWRNTRLVLLSWGMTVLLATCVLPPELQETSSGPVETPAAAAVLPTAPSDATATPGPVPAIPSMVGEVEIWHSLSDADLEFLEEAVAQMGAAYPDLSLSHTYVAPHRVVADLLKAILSGQGPELLLTPAGRLPDLHAEGLAIPWETLIREEDLEDLLAPALFGLIHEQSLLGLPLWAETVMLYANTDLVAQADVPETTAELLALAQDAPEPVAGLYLSLFHLSWGFPAFGGVLFDAAHKVVLEQSPGGAAFLQWLQQAHAAPGIVVSTDYDALRQSFLAGEMPLFLDGPWTLAAAEDALGHSLSIHEIPAGPVGPARPWLTTEVVLLMPGQSPAQQLVSAGIARELLTLADEMIDIAHRLPVTQHRMQAGSRAVRRFRELLPSTQHMPHVSEMTSVWRLGNQLLVQALSADASSADLSAAVVQFALLANEENGK